MSQLQYDVWYDNTVSMHNLPGSFNGSINPDVMSIPQQVADNSWTQWKA
jgi:hypothetical protein